MSRRERADIVVIGAGYAGAATAFFLARELGGRRVLVLEQESEPGRHSSGRNASLLRGGCGDPDQDPLAVEGADFLRDPPADFAADPGFRRVGSLFVDREERLGPRCVPGSQRVPVTAVLEVVPAFAAEPGTAAVWTPDDGVVDKAAVLRGYLEAARRAGVEFAFGEGVRALRREGGRVVGLQTTRRSIACAEVVIAAGAWAEGLGRSAGAAAAFRPTRRHLARTGPIEAVDPRAPYVWDLRRGFYFRPDPVIAEGSARAGLLLCACDQTDSEAGDCGADPGERERIVAAFRRVLPDWSAAPIEEFWAGHRTFGARSQGILGPDPEIAGLHWAAGLGGYGLSASAAVGRRVAAGLQQGRARAG